MDTHQDLVTAEKRRKKLCRQEAIHTVHIRVHQEAHIRRHVRHRVHHRTHHPDHIRAAVSAATEADGAEMQDRHRHPIGLRGQGPISRQDTVHRKEPRVRSSDAIRMIMFIIRHHGRIPTLENTMLRATTMRTAGIMIR